MPTDAVVTLLDQPVIISNLSIYLILHLYYALLKKIWAQIQMSSSRTGLPGRVKGWHELLRTLNYFDQTTSSSLYNHIVIIIMTLVLQPIYISVMRPLGLSAAKNTLIAHLCLPLFYDKTSGYEVCPCLDFVFCTFFEFINSLGKW